MILLKFFKTLVNIKSEIQKLNQNNSLKFINQLYNNT